MAEKRNEFFTRCGLIRIGGAIAVDLRDALKQGCAGCELRTAHMTLLYNSMGFANHEFQKVKEEAERFLARREGLAFTLGDPYMGTSNVIRGELRSLFEHICKAFPDHANMRECHVRLRREEAPVAVGGSVDAKSEEEVGKNGVVECDEEFREIWGRTIGYETRIADIERRVWDLKQAAMDVE